MQTPRPPLAARRPPSGYQEVPDVWWGQHGIDALIFPKPYTPPAAARLDADTDPAPVPISTPKELIPHV